MFRTAVYWTTLIAPVLLILMVSLQLIMQLDAGGELVYSPPPLSGLPSPPPDFAPAPDLTGIDIAYGALLLSAVTTFTGVYFGWRRDRREAKDLALKVRELERRLEERENQENSN